MEQLYEFYPTINRFFLMVRAFVNHIMNLFGIHRNEQNQIKIQNVQKSPTEEYIEKKKYIFLQTFQNENADYNYNIDSIIRDPILLAETLANPDNEYEKIWKRRILIENTPRGNVFMFYDLYKRAFSYYCDQAVMPYDIMNAVAMKYVITYGCRDFFIDSSCLLSVKQQPEIESDSNTYKKKTVEFDKNAFAKFKSYNNTTKKTTINEKDKTINCFLYLGGTRNWNPIIKNKKINPLNGFKTDMVPSNTKLSYEDYKKMKNNSS
jgi:hypothetical protein